MELKRIAEEVIAAATNVHRALGTSRTEMSYETALEHELARRGLQIGRQVPATGEETGPCADLVAESALAVFIYAVEAFTASHEARIRDYLRRSGLSLALVIEFRESLIENGITWVRASIS